MLEFQEKKKIRRLLYSRYTSVFLAVILVFLANATYNMYQKARDTSKNKNDALFGKNALETKQTELELYLEQLKTDRGIEEEIRKKYRVVKDGESVIIVVDDKKEVAGTTTEQSGFEPLFRRIKNLFR